MTWTLLPECWSSILEVWRVHSSPLTAPASSLSMPVSVLVYVLKCEMSGAENVQEELTFLSSPFLRNKERGRESRPAQNSYFFLPWAGHHCHEIPLCIPSSVSIVAHCDRHCSVYVPAKKIVSIGQIKMCLSGKDKKLTKNFVLICLTHIWSSRSVMGNVIYFFHIIL